MNFRHVNSCQNQFLLTTSLRRDEETFSSSLPRWSEKDCVLSGALSHRNSPSFQRIHPMSTGFYEDHFHLNLLLLHAASNPALNSSAVNSEFICLFSSLPPKTNYLQSGIPVKYQKPVTRKLWRERESASERERERERKREREREWLWKRENDRVRQNERGGDRETSVIALALVEMHISQTSVAFIRCHNASLSLSLLFLSFLWEHEYVIMLTKA